MFKIRFHLGAGSNFQNWQIKNGKDVSYYDPGKFSILAIDCKLKNYPKIAQRIFDGENKTVCAYIQAKYVIIIENMGEIKPPHEKISFNPKKFPHWINSMGENLDNKEYSNIITKNRETFIIY